MMTITRYAVNSHHLETTAKLAWRMYCKYVTGIITQILLNIILSVWLSLRYKTKCPHWSVHEHSSLNLCSFIKADSQHCSALVINITQDSKFNSWSYYVSRSQHRYHIAKRVQVMNTCTWPRRVKRSHDSMIVLPHNKLLLFLNKVILVRDTYFLDNY